jgi:hypothetical protein
LVVSASNCVSRPDTGTDITTDSCFVGAITVFAAVSSEFVYRFCQGKPLHALTPGVSPIVLSATSPADPEPTKEALMPVEQDGKSDANHKLAGPATAPASMAGGGFMGIPQKLRLALSGLALSIALITIRCVPACRECSHPGTEQRTRTDRFTA